MYFLLTFVFSLPFWALGALVNRHLLPGLPLSALGVVCPAAAAVLLSFLENGRSGVGEQMKRSLDFARIRSKVWYLPTILLMPLVSFAAYEVMRAAGTAVPALQVRAARALGLFLGFFVGAVCEELGWSGYATGPLQERFGALTAALIIGTLWAAWHFIPLTQAHRSLAFVAWWTLGTVSLRVIIVWLYNNSGGSVFVAALFHAMSNLMWQLFPVDGSSYDPRVMGPILAVVAVLVIAVWGPRTLTRRPA